MGYGNRCKTVSLTFTTQIASAIALTGNSLAPFPNGPLSAKIPDRHESLDPIEEIAGCNRGAFSISTALSSAERPLIRTLIKICQVRRDLTVNRYRVPVR